MGVDALPIQDRLKYGQEKEEKVRKCLNENYVFNLVKSSRTEDMSQKTDCWHVNMHGDRFRVAIKAREAKADAEKQRKYNDILVELYKPFYGMNSPNNKVGRDMKFEYHWYISLSSDGGVIRVANGQRVHEICNDMWKEWLAQDITPCAAGRWKFPLLFSETHPTCELWMHRDAYDHKPKVLGFIPPGYLKEWKKEIEYFDYIGE